MYRNLAKRMGEEGNVLITMSSTLAINVANALVSATRILKRQKNVTTSMSQPKKWRQEIL